MSAYTDDRPFSIDLVGAVLRQCSFIDKMHNLKWTELDRFSGNDTATVLYSSITRYHV